MALSITDRCIGWDETERLLHELAAEYAAELRGALLERGGKGCLVPYVGGAGHDAAVEFLHESYGLG